MPSGTIPSVAELIRRDFPELTRNERRAAQRLLTDYPVAGLDTVAKFGASAGVSAPTVLRMIGKLGFDSYGAFQAALRTELAAQRETPLTKGEDIASSNDRLARFAEASIVNIRETVANIAPDEFEAIARLLADRNRPVHLLGGRFTDALAGYMTAHLRVMRPQVKQVAGQQANWFDQMLDIGKRDVIILFDIRRYSDTIAELAREAAGRGATIILFTDQWLSPVSGVARHVLPARITAPSIWDSSGGLLLLVEALLSAVARELGPGARDRLNAIEKMR